MDTEDTDDQIAELEFRTRRVATYGLILNLYGYLGALISVGALGYLLFNQLVAELTNIERLSLFAALSGAFISIISFAMSNFRKNQVRRDRDLALHHEAVGRFLSAWSELEKSLRAAAFGSANKESDEHRLRDAIGVLRNEKKLDVMDGLKFSDLIQLRNSLVHRSSYVSKSEIDEALEEIVKILSKLM